jgi:tetratricopeptide (TPR) repeat protein
VIWQYAWPASAVLAILCLWLLRNRLGWGPVTALLFFAAVLFPMLGFFNLYTFLYTYVADHYQYAASIGPIALVAAAGAIVFGKTGKNTKLILLLSAGVLIVTLGILTWRQSRVYTNSDTLWRDTLKKNPDSWLAHGQIGSLLYKQGKFDETLYHLDRVLELASYVKKVDPRAYSQAFYNKGLIFAAKGRLEDAAEQYRKSLDMQEDTALVHLQLADILAEQGKAEEAILHYRRALDIATAKEAEYLAEDVRQRLEFLEKQGVLPPATQ